MLGNLIGGFIVILVGVNLAPTVANQVAAATQGGGNVTGAAASILGLVPLFFNLSIMAAAIGIAVAGLRNVGLA